MLRGFQVFASGMALAGVTLGGGTVAAAQEPAPATQEQAAPAAEAAPQEPAAPVLTLSGDAAIVTLLIKPGQEAAFEEVLAKLKESLGKSENAARRRQAAGWKVYKSSQMAQGNAVYIFLIDPVVANEEYDITRLIAEVFPVEVQDLFVKYRDSFAGRAISEVRLLMQMQ